jgi:hypothetical protein
MRAGKHAVGLTVAIVLMTAPRLASATAAMAAARNIHAHIGGVLGVLGRVSLVLASVGYSRAGMWKEALRASRALVVLEDDPSYACVAQAAVAWQESEASSVRGTAFSEWLKLHALVQRLETDRNVVGADAGMCREAYRRVTGQMALQLHRTSDLERVSLERLKTLYAAYQNAAQSGVAADGAAPRR